MTIELSPEAIARLQAVVAHMQAEPRRFTMASSLRLDEAPPCGTCGCIAGWMTHLDHARTVGATEGWGVVEDAAADLLEVPCDMHTFAGVHNDLDLLFYSKHWPAGFEYDKRGDIAIWGNAFLTRDRFAWVGSRTHVDSTDAVAVVEARRKNVETLARLVDSIAKAGGIWWGPKNSNNMPAMEDE